MILCGRTEKRLPVAITVHLKGPGHRERAISENMSSRGLRIRTKKRWKPGAELQITSDHREFQGPARVVYCQPGPNQSFFVGLEVKECVADSIPARKVATDPARQALAVFQRVGKQK